VDPQSGAVAFVAALIFPALLLKRYFSPT